MNEIERDDWLVRTLRAAAPPPVEDDGFTTRVMQAIEREGTRDVVAPDKALARLQTRRRHERERMRYSVVGAAAGVVFAALVWSSGATASDVAALATTCLAAVMAIGWALVRSERSTSARRRRARGTPRRRIGSDAAVELGDRLVQGL